MTLGVWSGLYIGHGVTESSIAEERMWLKNTGLEYCYQSGVAEQDWDYNWIYEDDTDFLTRSGSGYLTSPCYPQAIVQAIGGHNWQSDTHIHSISKTAPHPHRTN